MGARRYASSRGLYMGACGGRARGACGGRARGARAMGVPGVRGARAVWATGGPTERGSLAAAGYPVARARPLGLRWSGVGRAAPSCRFDDDGSAREPRGPRPGCVPPVGPSPVVRHRLRPAPRRTAIGSRSASHMRVGSGSRSSSCMRVGSGSRSASCMRVGSGSRSASRVRAERLAEHVACARRSGMCTRCATLQRPRGCLFTSRWPPGEERGADGVTRRARGRRVGRSRGGVPVARAQTRRHRYGRDSLTRPTPDQRSPRGRARATGYPAAARDPRSVGPPVAHRALAPRTSGTPTRRPRTGWTTQRRCRMPSFSIPQAFATSIAWTTFSCLVFWSALMLTVVICASLAAMHRRVCSSA